MEKEAADQSLSTPQQDKATHRRQKSSSANTLRKKPKSPEELADELRLVQKDKKDLWDYAYTGPKFKRDLICILEMPVLTWEEQNCKKALRKAERKREKAARKTISNPEAGDKNIHDTKRRLSKAQRREPATTPKSREEVLSAAMRSANPYRRDQAPPVPSPKDSVEKISPLTRTSFPLHSSGTPVSSKTPSIPPISSGTPSSHEQSDIHPHIETMSRKKAFRATRMTDFMQQDPPSPLPPVPLKIVETGYAPAAKPATSPKSEMYRCDICGGNAVAGYNNMMGTLHFCSSCYEPHTPIELPPSPKVPRRRPSKPSSADSSNPSDDSGLVLPRTQFRSPLSMMVNQTRNMANADEDFNPGLLSMWIDDLIDEDDPYYNPPTPPKDDAKGKGPMLPLPHLPPIEPTSPLRPSLKKRVASSVYPDDDSAVFLSGATEGIMPPIPDKFRQEWQKGNKRSIFQRASPFASLGEAGIKAVNDLLAERGDKRTTYYGLLEDYLAKRDEDLDLEEKLKGSFF